MGLCASSAARDGGSDKYQSDGETKENKPRSFSNTTEKKTETALAAAKARRLVVSDVGGFERDESFVCPKYTKTQEQTDMLTKSLSGNFFMFQDLEDTSKTDMVSAMQVKNKRMNDELMHQGDSGENMFVIESGTFNVVLSGNIVKQCGPSDVVGELALIYQAPRAATVVCTSNEAIVWALDRAVFRNLIARVAASKADSTSKLLTNYPLFKGIGENLRSGLIDVVIPVHFTQGENIVQQGDEGNTFYIIKSGSVTCTDENDTGSAPLQLNEGQHFGELGKRFFLLFFLSCCRLVPVCVCVVVPNVWIHSIWIKNKKKTRLSMWDTGWFFLVMLWMPLLYYFWVFFVFIFVIF